MLVPEIPQLQVSNRANSRKGVVAFEHNECGVLIRELAESQ